MMNLKDKSREKVRKRRGGEEEEGERRRPHFLGLVAYLLEHLVDVAAESARFGGANSARNHVWQLDKSAKDWQGGSTFLSLLP